jgi:hypothetical protein
MENITDIRKEKINKVVSEHLMNNYGTIIGIHTYAFQWRGNNNNEFNFIIDVNSMDPRTNRKIKKEISNLCKYLFGKNDTINGISFNLIKP